MAGFDVDKYFSQRADNGPVESNSPGELTREKMNKVHQAAQAKQLGLLQQYQEGLERSYVRERTGEEITSDAGAQFGIGSGNTVRGIGETAKVVNNTPQLPGAMGLASLGVDEVKRRINGWLGADEVIDQGSREITDAGKNAAEYWHEELSEPRKKTLALKQARIAEAEKEGGQLKGLRQGFVEALSDPENLIEQVPNLAAMAAIGRQGGTNMAIAGGAALQGGDVAGQTREALDKLSPEQFEQNSPEYTALIKANTSPEEARRIVTDQKVQEAYLAGATVSAVLNKFMPGGSAIEQVLAGQAVKSTSVKALATATAKAALGETLSEGGEEGSGQLISNERVSQINPEQSLTEGVGAATGLGMGMGLQMGGSISTVSGAANFAGTKAQKVLERAEQRQADQAVIEAAITANDPTPFLDRTTATYDPAKAIQVLHGAGKAETATPAVKQANLQQASAIVTELATERDALVEDLAMATPEGVAQKVVEAKAARNTALADALEQEVALLTAKPMEAAVIQAKQAKIAQLDATLAQARTRLDVMGQEFAPKAEELDVAAEVATATASIDPANTQAAEVSRAAAERVINLSMASPEAVTPAQAAALEANTSNGLTVEQRGYLRQFSEARIEANKLKTMGKVSQAIYFGDAKDVGIAQYQTRFAQAVKLADTGAAAVQLAGLNKFAKDHQAKATVAREAMAQQGLGAQIIRTQTGAWQVAPQKLSDKQVRANGGVTLNSPRLVTDIGQEAKALVAAAGELQAAFDLQFTSAPAVNSKSQVTPVTSSTSATAVEGQNQSDVDSSVDATASTPSPVAQAAPAVKQAPEKSVGEATPVDVESSLPTEINPSTKNVEGKARLEEEASSPQKAEAVASLTVAPSPTARATAAPSGASATVAPEDQVEVVAEEAPAPVVQAGTLSVFATEAAPQRQNLVRDFFKQVLQREGDATSRPLVAVKDFLSQWIGRAVSMKDFLQVPEEGLSDPQLQVLRLFQQKARAWQGGIQSNLVRGKNPDYYFKDLMQFLVQGDGTALTLDENVKTAIAYAAFSWVAENASRAAYNSPEEINLILNRDEDHRVSRTEEAKLAQVGTRQNVVVNALGQRAVQALGLKVSPEAAQNLLPQLESALGGHVMKLLMDQGVLARTTLSKEDMASLMQSPVDKTAPGQFLKIARTHDILNPQAKEIVDATKGTQGILDKLFSVESGLKAPSLTPIPFNQKTAKNTRQGIPEKLAKIIAHENAVANYVRQDMWGLLTQLDRDVALDMAGVEDLSEAAAHVVRASSVKAKNDALEREFDRFVEYVSDTLLAQADKLATAMYFEHSVWKQQRVGIATNVINPQSSKIHRFLLFRKSWETQVDTTDTKQLDNFRLRVLEGLGVKTDKQSNVKSLAGFDAKTGAPEIQAAVAVLRKSLTHQDLTAADQQALAEGVKAGGEKFHSLDALMALAHYENAVAAGQTTFTVQMMGEVDGVTNGPMLSHLLLGAAATAKDLMGLLNKGGFYEAGNAHTQYNLWREAAKHLDLYETTTLHMVQNLRQLFAGKREATPLLTAVHAFTGDLLDAAGKVTKDGRNIIKTPLTAMVFGSSVPKAIDSMAGNFIESIYDAFEKTGGMDATARAQVIQHVNTLLGSPKLRIAPSTTATELLLLEFNKAQEAAIKDAFKATLGKAVETTIKQDFNDFITQRKQLNQAAQLSFELYNAVYTSLRAQFITEQVTAGKIAVDGTGNPTHDLTAPQEAELRKRIQSMNPVVHTLMSKDSQDLGSGLHMSKSAKKLSTQATYQSELHFGQPFADNGAKSTKANSYEQVAAGPGVSVAPMTVHSTDSAISHSAAALAEVLNIHDAHGAGLGTFEQTARNLNEATWNAMLNYSPASEVFAALERSLNGLATFLAQDTVSPDVLKNLQQALDQFADKNQLEPKGLLLGMAYDTKAMAFHADDVKLAVLAQLTTIDQYALEGGNYVVTAANRAEAQAKRESLSPEIDAKTLTSIEAISAKLGTLSQSPETTMKSAALEEDTSSWGLELPGVQTLQLLEHAIQDTALPQKLRDNLARVREAMWAGAQSFDAALTQTLKGLDKANVISTLASRWQAVDPSLWGDRGTPVIASDPDLVALFEQRGEITAQQALQVLKAKFGQDGAPNLREFNQRILAALTKLVSPALKLHYVTPATAAETVLALPDAERSRGWYVAKGGAAAIYVLSPDFVHSGLTAETLLHELLHASLAGTIDAELAAKQAYAGYTSEALQLVEELETLRTKAQEYTQQKGLTQYAPALANVQELVAWGMSNLAFQKDVLNQIQMESGTRGNALVTGMKKFIDALVGLLFRKSTKSEQAIADNGMAILLSNVSGLFHQAAQQKTQAEVNLSQQGPDPIAEVRALTTTQLFDALALASQDVLEPGFQDHLRGLLGGIVTKLHGPFGSFKATLAANVGLSPLDMVQKARDEGVMPFASKVLAAPFRTPDPVAFVLEQVEATVRAALEDNTGQTTAAYSELSKLYQAAYRHLKGSGQLSDEQFAFLFEIEATNGSKSDYLARFAALGLAHPEVHKALQFGTQPDSRRIADGKTLLEKLGILFDQLLNLLNGKLTHTYDGQRADAKLTALVQQLVGIEARKQRKLVVNEASRLGAVETAVRDLAEGARAKIGDIASSKFFKENRFPLVQGAAAVVTIVAKDRVAQVIQGLTDIRNKHSTAKNDFIAGVLNELRGVQPIFQALLRAVKHGEKQRKELITWTAQNALESFANQGKDLSPEDKAALSQVFLRTDMAALLEAHGVEGLQRLLASPTSLHTAIQDQEHQLAQFSAYQHYYLTAAKLLAHKMVKGAVKGEHVVMNAGNIAHLYGTPFAGRVSAENAAKAEGILDQLVSLRALQNTSTAHKAAAQRVLDAEMARTDQGNGVEMVLRLHRDLQQQSKERLFKDSAALMMKGYLPEVYNPNTGVQVANLTDGADLEALGWVRGASVRQDAADPDQAVKHQYVLKDGGLNRYLTGAFSLTSERAKGSFAPASDSLMPQRERTALMETQKQAAIRRMFQPNPGFNPDTVTENFTAPTLNAAGEIVDYRYLMHDTTKDTLLERDNRFEKLLGTLAGSIYDKETSPEQNRRAVQALKDQYDAEYALKPDAYVKVGMTSTDPEMRDIYRMLPEKTKQAVREIWGRESEMMVRADLLDINFGYRKLSAADVFAKDPDDRGKGEDALVWLVERMLYSYARVQLHKSPADAQKYTRRAEMVVRRNERIWQEVVHEIKDIIVVKTGTVLVGNILANVSLLAMNGVSIGAIIRHHRVALKGVATYRKANAQRFRLQTQLDTGYLPSETVAELEREIVRLDDAMARNPVKELIDAGLMPTIVEDVAADDDIYSYKSAFVRKMDRYTGKLNPKVVEAGRLVYMAHDTQLYQGLSHATQVSDFVARYTLYQHLTTQKTPMAKADAIQEASDAFVNYDIPMQRGIQYLDDSGILMFTKYFLRIQRVLLKLTREHPTRVLGMMLLNNFFDLMPMVTDSSALARIGNNPFSTGMFQFPATLDELATVDIGLRLFN